MEQRECFANEEELNLYLDGELGAERQLILKTHLMACQSCSGRFEIALNLKSAIKRSCENVAAPPWLRERILNAIKNEEPVRAGYFWESVKSLFSGRPLVPVGIAAMLIIILASALFYGRPGSGNMPFIRGLVHEHYEYMEEAAISGIESDNPGEISEWVLTNAGMEIHLPSRSRSLAPEGACVLQENEETIGYVYYNDGDRRISLFMLEDKYDGLFGQKTMKFEDISMYCGRCTGLNYVLWKNNDIVCVLVGDLPEASLVGLAKDFI
ncbi:MAG: zf-HC2 domain-containing protein [Candidatus Zixiibacteriota bacterium]|nr:MAG: zf-HC2 domain-containing protein [candidate division Zixibacteria bacterium]